MRFTSPLPSAKVVDRESFILSRCHGARVLHLGCVDSGLLEERLSCANLLHAALSKASRDLWGIDLDAAGLDRLRNEGFVNLYEGSAEAIPPAIPRGYFDVVLAGELIEHISNPGLLLDSAAAC